MKHRQAAIINQRNTQKGMEGKDNVTEIEVVQGCGGRRHV
jgi:hypothetical protein